MSLPLGPHRGFAPGPVRGPNAGPWTPPDKGSVPTPSQCGLRVHSFSLIHFQSFMPLPPTPLFNWDWCPWLLESVLITSLQLFMFSTVIKGFLARRKMKKHFLKVEEETTTAVNHFLRDVELKMLAIVEVRHICLYCVAYVFVWVLFWSIFGMFINLHLASCLFLYLSSVSTTYWDIIMLDGNMVSSLLLPDLVDIIFWKFLVGGLLYGIA